MGLDNKLVSKASANQDVVASPALCDTSLMIPYGRQSISPSDIEAVVRVLRSDFLTQGPAVPAFEAAVAKRVQVSHAVAVNSATSALHIACLALGVGPGDEVWTSPNSFVASSNCALYCGASVDFVDIDPATLCLCERALEDKLRDHRGAGKPLPKVLIPVHFGGQSCHMQEIHRLALEYGFKVIEDASHAIGGSYLGTPVGSCQFSDITVFSFHPVKIITTGEGGMATTQKTELYEKLIRLRSHGITRDAGLMAHEPEGAWYYEQLELGLNYRMTDIQAALGLSQLTRLESFVERRRALAAIYDDELLDLVKKQEVPAYTASARHLYPIQINPADRARVFTDLRSTGIGVNVHYIPIYWHPFYAALGFNRGHCPNAEHYYLGAISLPLYADLTPEQHEQVIEKLKDITE